MTKKILAEFLGTFWLVLGGCGSAVLAANFMGSGIGLLGVSLAFGLTVFTIAYSLGHISGAHLNPAVTFGLWANGKFKAKEILPYIIAQTIGAIAAAGILYIIATGNGSDIAGFAANGFGENSPGNYGVWAAIVSEFVMTFMFLTIIIGVLNKKAPKGFAGATIGLALTLIHLISIPVTNTSVNPARSISQALFAGGSFISQLWLFILVPIIAAICAGKFSKYLQSEEE